MARKNKLLTVLSEAEQYSLYGLPDFDDAKRMECLVLTETELALAVSRPGFPAIFIHSSVAWVTSVVASFPFHIMFEWIWYKARRSPGVTFFGRLA